LSSLVMAERRLFSAFVAGEPGVSRNWRIPLGLRDSWCGICGEDELSGSRRLGGVEDKRLLTLRVASPSGCRRVGGRSCWLYRSILICRKSGLRNEG